MSKIIVDSETLKKTANYVAATQPIVEQFATLKGVLAKRASAVVDQMISRGIVSEHLKEAKVQKLVADPAELMEQIEKVASFHKEASIGTGVPRPMPLEKTANEKFRTAILG